MKQLSLKRINASSPYDVMMVKSKYLYIVNMIMLKPEH